MINKDNFIICISNNTEKLILPNLTIGKQYKVLEVRYDTLVNIIDDTGNSCHYNINRFKPIWQVREQKINNLLK